MPTIVYRYGCLAPVEQRERIADQIHLAHVYQNKLIEIERKSREEREGFLQSIEPLGAVTRKISEVEAALAAARSNVSAERSEARSKAAGDVEAVKKLRADLKALWPERKAAMKTVLALPEVKERLDAMSEARKVAFREARAASGVYWGTYCMIEAAVEQARQSPTKPNFQRWTGDGAVGTQLIHGVTKQKLEECSDTRIQLSLAPAPVPGRGGKPLPRLRVRVGSEGRNPIFGEWPIILHRPLPEGSTVKWIKVLRQRVGPHDQWSAHFMIDVPEAKSDGANAPLAVNLRWALEADAVPTAAEWSDEQESGVLKVDKDVAGVLKKVDDLRSIRDRQFEEIKAMAMDMIKGLTLPDELKDKLQHLHAWRAGGKLAGVVVWLRDHRFSGDERLFAELEAWRKQDKHLWLWESNARQKALARRKDNYRVFAAKMVKSHGVLVIEKLDIAKVAAKPEVGDERDFSDKASSQRFLTAPSELRSALINAFKRAGREVVLVGAGLTSRQMLESFMVKGGDKVEIAQGRSQRTLKRLEAKKAKRNAA